MLPKRATATGWGDIDNDYNQAQILQKVDLVLFSEYECIKIWGKPLKRLYRKHSVKSIVCYGDNNSTKKDTCRGDSGGPIQIEFGPKNYMIVGITSFGSEICGSGPPAAYTNVAFYLPWLHSYIKRN